MPYKALTHNRVYNRFTPNAYTSWPPVLRWNAPNQLLTRQKMNQGLTRKNVALSTPGSRKQALTVGTVGSSAATKRAWKRQSRYTIDQVNAMKSTN